MIDVSVEDGRVKLIGTIFDDRQRDAVRVAAENIPGVKGIEDQLVWIEPMSGVVIGPRADRPRRINACPTNGTHPPRIRWQSGSGPRDLARRASGAAGMI